jgi:hypothetical protein
LTKVIVSAHEGLIIMPRRPSPRSLRQCSLNAVAVHFEAICYGAKRGTKELHRLIESDAITQGRDLPILLNS